MRMSNITNKLLTWLEDGLMVYGLEISPMNTLAAVHEANGGLGIKTGVLAL